MATEKRLIDAYKEVQKLYSLPESRYVLETNPAARKIIDWFFHAPTVDAVEVVRCKDCKKWHRHTKVDRERGDCRRYQTTKRETGFCDRGERKDND